jgi:predicted HTH transcriptional regulator
LIAQNLSFFHRIDELGGGIGRMKAEMVDHGLDRPRFGSNSGFLEVVLPGPGDDIDRLRVRAVSVGKLVPPSVETQLNARQKEIMARILADGSVTNRWCRSKFGVVYNTAYRDLQGLVELGLVEPEGRGRSVRYVLKKGNR